MRRARPRVLTLETDLRKAKGVNPLYGRATPLSILANHRFRLEMYFDQFSANPDLPSMSTQSAVATGIARRSGAPIFFYTEQNYEHSRTLR
jgi:hypothetical protein